MVKLKQWLVVVPAFVSLVLAGGKSPQAYAAKNADDRKAPIQLALPLDSMDGLEVRGISDEGAERVKFEANVASYRGRPSVRIVNIEGPRAQTGEQVLGIVKTSDFKDGTIEAAVAGVPRQGAPSGTRGFIGIAFRVQDNGARFEAFYLRMTNGRADDQLQRNHSVQYVSHPVFTWRRLREENPGVYESYVDLEAGAWTRIKIVVAGAKAQLYVNGADQPCLIVNDLKLGESRGQVALWVGSDTEAYFANLAIK